MVQMRPQYTLQEIVQILEQLQSQQQKQLMQIQQMEQYKSRKGFKVNDLQRTNKLSEKVNMVDNISSKIISQTRRTEPDIY